MISIILFLKRVLISSHDENYKYCFDAFLEGYRLEYEKMGDEEYDEIIKNIGVVESRGRYIKPEARL